MFLDLIHLSAILFAMYAIIIVAVLIICTKLGWMTWYKPPTTIDDIAREIIDEMDEADIAKFRTAKNPSMLPNYRRFGRYITARYRLTADDCALTAQWRYDRDRGSDVGMTDRGDEHPHHPAMVRNAIMIRVWELIAQSS